MLICRNTFSSVPKGKVREVAQVLKAIHAQEDMEEARRKARAAIQKLGQMKPARAAEVLGQGAKGTLSYCELPSGHWRRARTNNSLGSIMKEIRLRTSMVGSFPNGHPALATQP